MAQESKSGKFDLCEQCGLKTVTYPFYYKGLCIGYMCTPCCYEYQENIESEESKVNDSIATNF